MIGWGFGGPTRTAFEGLRTRPRRRLAVDGAMVVMVPEAGSSRVRKGTVRLSSGVPGIYGPGST